MSVGGSEYLNYDHCGK